MRNFSTLVWRILMTCSIIAGGSCFAAAVNLPWSTTFNCDDWTQSQGTLTCDGMITHGIWYCTDSENRGETINSSANYSGGGGGKGQIHYLGPALDENSGGLKIILDTPVSEFWFRAYVKYDPTITWSSYNYQKMFYITGAGAPIPGGYIIPELFGGGGGHPDQFNMALASGNNWSGIGWGWTSKFSDGNWHCVEFHIKANTKSSPYNGVVQVWIDDTLIINLSNRNLGSNNGQWTTFFWGSNVSGMSGSTCKAVYYDDIAISPPSGFKVMQ
jgi:hypothetical protein